MPLTSVRIPQMGEGLQEARLVEFLKKPGDRVRRDEPLYIMETDKAVTEVESPMEGVLVEWLVEADSVLPIGTEVARMEVSEGAELPAVAHGHHGRPSTASSAPPSVPSPAPSSSGHGARETSRSSRPGEERRDANTLAASAAIPESTSGNGSPRLAAPLGSGSPRAEGDALIPPRTRKYLREKGLLDRIGEIPASGKKLLPEDVDRYLESLREARPSEPERDIEPIEALASGARSIAGAADFVETVLPKAQQTLNYRMQRGMAACIPAVLEMEVEWSRLGAARERLRATTGETGFSMFAWCVTQAMCNFPLLRSSLSGDGKTLRTYRHVHLGVAVAVEDGLLRTAVVRDADRLNRPSFAATLREQIERARTGEDQIDASTTFTISNIGGTGVRMGIPVVVPPAVATMAVGMVRPQPFPTEGHGFQFRPVATVVMTFDHRVLNGVAAAEFLGEVRRIAESFTLNE